jgi:hypothetical protein
MAFVDSCPPIVVERVMRVDLGSSENSELFSWIAGQAPLDCQVQAVVAIAARLNRDSHPQVISDFCSSVGTYSRFFTPLALEQIKHAYMRFPYSDEIALNYFNGLRLTGLDIRDYLKPRVTLDWSFTHPRTNAATWHYFLYLASLNEPGALEALAAKIAQTKNGNDATNLLESLSHLPGEGVADILRSYAKDQRRSDGTEEPGPTIAEMVGVWLMMRTQ